MLTPWAESFINKYLRWLSVAGAAGSVVYGLRQDDLAAHSDIIRSLFLFTTIAVVLFLATGLSGSFKKVLHHKDLIVPQLMLIAVHGALRYVFMETRFSEWNEPLWNINWLGSVLPVTPHLLLGRLCGVIYAGWLTDLILRAFQRREVSLFGSLRNINKWFWKALVALHIGEGVILAVGPALVWVPTVPRYFVGVVVALGWNLATSALLLTLVAGGRLTWRQIARGVAASWKIRRKIILPLAIQLLILGCLTVPPAKLSTGARAIGADAAGLRLRVSVFWVGDYPEISWWYSRARTELWLPPSLLMANLFALVLTPLSIALKVKVMEELSAEFLPDAEKDETYIRSEFRLRETVPGSMWKII